jgi:hypothetical protein
MAVELITKGIVRKKKFQFRRLQVRYWGDGRPVIFQTIDWNEREWDAEF